MNIVIKTKPTRTPRKPDFDTSRSLDYTIRNVQVKEIHENYVFITFPTLEAFLKLGALLQHIVVYYEICFKERGYKISMTQCLCCPE